VPCVPAATFTTCRAESAEPTATTFERPPSLLPAPSAVESLPDAVELLPTAVLFEPDATEPEQPADEFEPLAPGRHVAAGRIRRVGAVRAGAVDRDQHDLVRRRPQQQ
jgi:hypothetical protein